MSELNIGKTALEIIIDTIPADDVAIEILKQNPSYKFPLSIDIINPIKDDNIKILSEPSVQIWLDNELICEFKTKTIFQFVSPFSEEGTIQTIVKIINSNIVEFENEIGKKGSVFFQYNKHEPVSQELLYEKVRISYLANWSN